MADDGSSRQLSTINRTIGRLREDVQELTGEVKKISRVIREAAQSIRDAIQENIQAQAELKLMEHMMEVQSIKPQIEAEHGQIRAERSELDDRLKQIDERYQRKHAELDEKARDRIRNLGSHIFEIDEQQFEAGIEEPFTEQVTTAWQTLQSHNDDVGERRTNVISETANETVQTIRDYIDRQEQLIADIENHRFDPDTSGLPSDEFTLFQAPYYVVEYEHEGVRNRKTVVPSMLKRNSGDWCTVSLVPIEGVDRLMRDIDGVADPASTKTLTDNTLRSVLDQYCDSSVLEPSYPDTIAETAPDGGIEIRHEVID